MLLKRSVLVLVAFCLVTIGCSTTSEQTPNEIIRTLQAHGYTPLEYGYLSTRPPEYRVWISVCKDKNGKEFIVVVGKDSNVRQLSQLGVENRLTREQMKKVVLKGNLNPDDLSINLDRTDGSLYWNCDGRTFALDGTTIAKGWQGNETN